MKGVQQQLVLGPLFVIYIIELDVNVVGMICMFVDDIKIHGIVAVKKVI